MFIDAKLDKRRTTQRKTNHLSISKALDGMLVSVKLARSVPAERNRGDIIEARYEGRRIINNCVFIDECGYNVWTSRSCGRARVGEREYRQVSGQRGRNVAICLAVSPINALVHRTAQLEWHQQTAPQ